ncbi:MAG: TIM barrel protein [Chloroflexi bacterium]|nr:TIM barrel protein [Chloroflexota bacterium]
MRLAIGSGPALREFHGDVAANAAAVAKSLRWWKARGVEGVVFYDALPNFYRTSPESFRAVKQVLDDEGIEVAGFNALRKSLHMPELIEYDTRRLDHCLAVCEVLRPAIFDMSVNVPIPDGMDPMEFAARPLYRGDFARVETFALAAQGLKSLAQRLATMKALLSIELHDDGVQDTAQNILKLIDLIDEPNVGANPDLGNWYRVAHVWPDSWRDQVRLLAPITNYWEVKNYKRIIVPEHDRTYSWNVLLDDGDIDFRESAVILWRAGFRGWVCNEGGTGDYVHSQVRYLTYMRWILDEWIPAFA